MRAIVQDGYGSAEVLRLARIARPEIGDHDVLLRVHAAGLDRGTWHLMTGQPYLLRPVAGLRRPRNPVPGLDVAGTVVAAGPGVTRFSVGDEVFGFGRGTLRRLRRRARRQARHQAGRCVLRAGRGGAGVRGHRPAGPHRRRPCHRGAESPRHRSVRRRRQLRGAIGQGIRGGGHRRVQHRETGSGALSRRQPCHRLHPRRLRRRRAPLRPDHRHRRQPRTLTAAPRAYRPPGPPFSPAARTAATGPAWTGNSGRWPCHRSSASG